MKYVLFFTLFIFSSFNLISQEINANYINPSFHDVGNYKYLRFGNSSQFYAGFMWNDGNNIYGNGNDFSIFTYDDRDITIRTGAGNFIIFPQAWGKVGIGTSSPEANLNIHTVFQSPNSYDVQKWTNTHHNGYNLTLRSIWDSNGINHSFIQKYNNVEYNSLSFANGRIGIGTTIPDSKLTVKGNIHAEEVKVDLSVPAPDYVFKEDYKIRTLEETQQFIKENGHLPNIPSAKELKENGIDLGVMNMKLLEKIEELTLYVIQQQKKFKKIDELEKEIKEMRKLYNQIENK